MEPARLCITVTAPTMAELRARRDAVPEADLVELRLDSVDRPDVAGALAGRTRPVIVTCRPAWEGGSFDGSEEERLAFLSEALTLGAEYVDVEWAAASGAILRADGGRRVILSMHDFSGVPADLPARVRAMRGTGAEVVKVAVMTSRLADCLHLVPLGGSADQPTVLIAMGEAGLATRILPARFGSCWTYAGDGAAPGQVTARRMLDEYGFHRIGVDTAIYGLLGRPVAHSVSPAMHNAAFRAAGIDAVYIPFEAASFDDFTVFAEAMDVSGASVTAPYKLDAFARAHETDPTSRTVGAVNTLKREGRHWLGANTDVAGFLAPLAPLEAWQGMRATVLGAGGAARSVATALASVGARVSIAARRADRGAAVAALTGATIAAWPPPAGSWDLLVNATPIGTAPRVDETPMPTEALTGQLVYDLVYNPPRTRLLDAAAAAGCRTIGGLEMLVAQAQAQFEWWTGIRPDAALLREAAHARLAGIRHP